MIYKFQTFYNVSTENEHFNSIEIMPDYKEKKINIIAESNAQYCDAVHIVNLDIYDIQDLIDALIKIKKDLNNFEVVK